MKSYKLLPLISFILLFVIDAKAQSDKIDNNLQKASATIKTLGSIFGTKKSKSSTVDNTTSATHSSKNADDTSWDQEKNTGAKLKAGDVALNAKVIDADELGYFNMGAAWVRKGDKTALIDTAGNFIVPFGKYEIENPLKLATGFDDDGESSINPGIFIVKQGGFLNSNGTFFPVYVGSLLNGYVVLMNNNSYEETHIYMDASGRKYTVKTPFENFKEGVGVTREGNSRALNYSKLEYKNIRGEVVIKPKYDEAYAFWEDRAIVGIKNEFGEIKYGIIDIKGKEITPCIYSIMPTHFSSGFSKIRPKDYNEFYYAFINRNGVIRIKQTLEDAKKYGTFGGFIDGYAYSTNYVMDTAGKITSQKEFLSNRGITEKFYVIKTQDGAGININYYTKGKILTDSEGKYGFIDLIRNKVVDPVFTLKDGYYSFHFDRVAKLSYAIRVVGYDKTNKEILREGYINEDGIFVIVKGEGSKW